MVHQLLGGPQRILAIRSRLHLGSAVQFHHHRRHELVAGTVVELRHNEATVREQASGQLWRLPYATLVPGAAAQAPMTPHAKTIEPCRFRVGDTAAFTEKHLRERMGTVVRVNERTVSLDREGQRWRMSPQLLRKIIDV